MNREITVFYDNTNYTLLWLRALLWAKEEFKEKGIKINLMGSCIPFRGLDKLYKKTVFNIKDSNNRLLDREYDIVFLAYHHTNEGLCRLTREERARILEKLKENSKMLVWLDTSDSTGTCVFDVLPFVDFYLKKQILSDVEYYKRPLYGRRLFWEYYHVLTGEGPEKKEIGEIYGTVLEEENVHKLGVSWNIGVSEYIIEKRNPVIYCGDLSNVEMVNPRTTRLFDIHFRGTIPEGIGGIQRRLFFDHLNNNVVLRRPDYSYDVNHKKYIDELRHSRSVFSPFGYGEICKRDFEAFRYGAALIKPDMSKIDTFPNWYLPEETYFPVAWDFSNLDDVFALLGDKESYEKVTAVSEKAQKLYYSFLRGGKGQFVDHVLKSIHVS